MACTPVLWDTLHPKVIFDFNVVIRSILYDAAKQYLSFQVGGAIVYDSVPEKEYEECLLKAKGMLEVLGRHSPDILFGHTSAPEKE